jgi:hypothetical protein
MNTKIDGLRSLVADESLPLTERRDAAAYVIRLMVESIPVPKADDDEVVELQKPWHDPFLAELGAAATFGRSLSGWSLKDAIAEVHRCHQLRAVLSIVVDDTAHRLERLAACQYVLDNSHPEGTWRRNNYSPENLLDKVEWRVRCKPNGGFEHYRADPPKGARPPMSLSDVWDV